jgi:hypothetical protein
MVNSLQRPMSAHEVRAEVDAIIETVERQLRELNQTVIRPGVPFNPLAKLTDWRSDLVES